MHHHWVHTLWITGDIVSILKEKDGNNKGNRGIRKMKENIKKTSNRHNVLSMTTYATSSPSWSSYKIQKRSKQ